MYKGIGIEKKEELWFFEGFLKVLSFKYLTNI
jgi:hypothetical protein